MVAPSSPPASAQSTPHSRSSKPDLELDLSSLPALSTPSPPSNTLIITNLYEAQIFTAPNLTTFRNLIASHLPSSTKQNEEHNSQPLEAPSINSFSPFKSLSRIIMSFTTVEAAIAVNQLLSGTPILNCMPKIYFGEPTPLCSELQDGQRRFLRKPDSGKLFFISPPPSPPCGWESKQEDAPNKEVWARDLEAALKGVTTTDGGVGIAEGAVGSGRLTEAELRQRQRQKADGRGRSGSLMVYDPQEHGDSTNLPAVMVEDTSEEPSPTAGGPILAHTARPPVELMDDA